MYGNKTVAPNGDSVDYVLPDFSYVDQDSNTVNASTIQNKIFATEFFFTSCPSICPKMQQQMLRFHLLTLMGSARYRNAPAFH